MASRSRFWVLSLLWVFAVFAATPFAFELFDRQGVDLLIPGLSVTASEVMVAAPFALVPLLLAYWRARRHPSHMVSR